jgi:hypothetical protein
MKLKGNGNCLIIKLGFVKPSFELPPSETIDLIELID